MYLWRLLWPILTRLNAKVSTTGYISDDGVEGQSITSISRALQYFNELYVFGM